VERGWQVLGLTIPTASDVRGNILVAAEWPTRAAGVSTARTKRSRRLRKAAQSNRTAERNRFGIRAGEILLHNHEHSEKYLPDSDFVSLVGSGRCHK
jgi:hypothetical protein